MRKNESRSHIDPPKNTILRKQSINFLLFLQKNHRKYNKIECVCRDGKSESLKSLKSEGGTIVGAIQIMKQCMNLELAI